MEFDPSLKYGNTIEGHPIDEHKFIQMILDDASKILPKGTEFSIIKYKGKHIASFSWRYPVVMDEEKRNNLNYETVIA